MLIKRADYSSVRRDLTPEWREDRHSGTLGEISSAGGWVPRASSQSGASKDQPGCGLPPEAKEVYLPAFLVRVWALQRPPRKPWGEDALQSQMEFCH